MKQDYWFHRQIEVRRSIRSRSIQASWVQPGRRRLWLSTIVNEVPPFIVLRLLLVALALMAIASGLEGCVSTESRPTATYYTHMRLYEGHPLSREQEAIIAPGRVFIEQLDGRPVPHKTLYVFELMPGQHTVCAGFYLQKTGSTVVFSHGCVQVSFDAAAGHTYEIYPVQYTHRKAWFPAIWDITNDLDHPEMAFIAARIVEVVNYYRPDPATHFAVPHPSSSASHLPGLEEKGEKHTATITGVRGHPVQIKYRFDRYEPFLLVKGSDGKEYHIQISQQTGDVVKVLGTKVIVGDFWKGKFAAFQPLGTEYAIVRNDNDEVTRVDREGPPGTYTRLDKWDASMLAGPQPIRIPTVQTTAIHPPARQG
jgi:hypothetical protein